MPFHTVHQMAWNMYTMQEQLATNSDAEWLKSSAWHCSDDDYSTSPQ
jgi:hypothetical protein